MIYTKAIIYNMALRNLAITASLTSSDITANTDTKAIVLNTYYEIAFEQALGDAEWNFAEAYAELDIEYECNVEGYSYAYFYPSDCVTPLDIVTTGSNEKFKITTDYPSFKKVINTNIENPTLRYTRMIKDEKYFSADFVMALSWYLSFLAAPALGMGAEQQKALSVYGMMINKAIEANGNQDNDVEEIESDILTARN